MNTCLQMSKKGFLLFCAFALHIGVIAQTGVGIGTNTPNNSAALHITYNSQPKGLLIPKMKTPARIKLGVSSDTSANSLLVFDKTLNKFCFYLNGEWYVLNLGSQQINSGTGLPGTITVNETVSATTVTAANYTSSSLTGNGPVPKGGIIMWSGSVVPDGWHICDGTDGTPNLSGRFIVASGTAQYPQSGDDNPTYNIGDTGGWNKYKLLPGEMPKHNHTGSSIGSESGHTHSYNRHSEKTVGKNAGGGEGAADANGTASATTGGGSSHTHSITIANSGNDQSHENRPPYYALAYIIKL